MPRFRLFILILLIAVCCAALLFASAWAGAIPDRAELLFGPPAPSLGEFERWRLAWSLVEQVDSLTLPADPTGEPQIFEIAPGQAALSVIEDLGAAELIRDAGVFRDYLVYTGADTRLVPGSYRLSPAMTAIEIAAEIQDIQAAGVTLRILPGWRAEEVAAAVAVSGLLIEPDEFLAQAMTPPGGGVAAYWPSDAGYEGLLFPDSYSLPRSLSASALAGILAENFRAHVDAGARDGFAMQGLDIFQAVTLASIVQREAVVYDEMPLIASVYLNRIDAGMKLDADPTVQYALGYSEDWGWWKAPLSVADLGVVHPYNTYLAPGLPPGPIASPGIEALLAVAFPESSGYYYFRAACDGSGRHVFAVTYEEHVGNACP